MKLNKIKKIFKKIKDSLRGDSQNLCSVSKISRKELKEKEKYYNDIVARVINDVNLYKNTKVDTIIATKKLTDYTVNKSLLDPMGSVIFKGEEIYRGVKPESLNNTIQLYESGLLQALAKNGLIPKTEITEYYTDEFPLILKHQKVNVIPPTFWSFTMMKDAAVNTIIINEVAKYFGYHLIDGHAANSAITRGKPIFIDIGSFVETTIPSFFTYEIIFSNLIVLLIKKIGNSYLSNKLLLITGLGATIPDCGLEESIEVKTYLKEFKKTHSKYGNKINLKLIEEIFDNKNLNPAYVDLLFKDYSGNTAWANYSHSCFKNIDELVNTDNRYSKVLKLLDKFSPDAESSLDLAGNSGIMSYLISKTQNYKSFVSTDYDEFAIDYGYINLKNSKVENYVLNFISSACHPQTIKLFKADVVLALAVTHHLILTQHNDINTIFSRIKKYCNKYIYIEFCPLGMYADGMEQAPLVPDWYTEEWFEENFKKEFELLHKETLATVNIAGKKEKHRVMFVGKIK